MFCNLKARNIHILLFHLCCFSSCIIKKHLHKLSNIKCRVIESIFVQQEVLIKFQAAEAD